MIFFYMFILVVASALTPGCPSKVVSIDILFDCHFLILVSIEGFFALCIFCCVSLFYRLFSCLSVWLCGVGWESE